MRLDVMWERVLNPSADVFAKPACDASNFQLGARKMPTLVIDPLRVDRNGPSLHTFIFCCKISFLLL
jgi:hypothetical protein